MSVWSTSGRAPSPERSVDDPSDPFQLIRIDGDDIAADPGRLADEAGTMGLFGGRRAIWVRATSRNIAPAVEAVLKAELQDTVIVIEGGDLPKSSPLRAICEKSPRAFALPCYADTGRDLGTVVDEAMKAGGFSISRRGAGGPPRLPRGRPPRNPRRTGEADPLCARPDETSAWRTWTPS